MFIVITAIVWLSVLLIGAVARWKWLVDPPPELRWFYFPAMLRTRLGVESTRNWLIVICLACLLAVVFLAVLG
jgi:hypothetical protein